MHSSDSKPLTSNFGAPVPDNQHSLTAGERGPVLLQDHHLIEKLAHFDRERIPERVVHAKGAGAFGYFEVTHDLSRYTKAHFLGQVGQKTKVLARFSTVGGERGSADAERDPRGFALKFYTDEGNYDLVGNNTPVFFIRDAFKFPDMVHTHKRNPQTNLKDANAFWDFNGLSPETTHQLTVLFSDRGIPASYRHMHGFGSHTFKWVNAEGKAVWVKYHFRTEAGIQNLTAEEAARTAAQDPDHATRDLFDHIAQGLEAAWEVSVQIMPLEDAETYRYDPFDITKVWLFKDYPRIPLGRLVLNQNPANYFAEIEQAAFSPSSFVPGIEASPDKLLQGRLFSYPDTQRHRLGPNYAQIPVNCPYATTAQNHQRDGAMVVNTNGGAAPNYFPNSLGDLHEAPRHAEAAAPVEGAFTRSEYPQANRAGDFEQAGLLYRLMKDDERERLVSNIANHMRPANRMVQLRAIHNFYRADKDYGLGIARHLGLPQAEVEAVAAMLAARV
ncbi:catalase [Geothrix sp. 21YS21S-4]|uniref:catalase n=1 Tax=Geothrix sp. 21YS21S-4 TaxID=3068889 RepID=UPI0027BA7C75|nr:catalase [Geothrix sp. 21YS21S-4]